MSLLSATLTAMEQPILLCGAQFNGIWFVIPTGNPSAPTTQQWGLFGDISN
jgi:hypothetical protein